LEGKALNRNPKTILYKETIFRVHHIFRNGFLTGPDVMLPVPFLRLSTTQRHGIPTVFFRK